MKRLCELIECEYETPIYGIKIDSREIKEGDLFVAVNGFNVSHSEFIEDAINKGAAAVITDIDYESHIPIVKVSDVNGILNQICIQFYGYQNNQKLIGITGTDGKTTTAVMIKELLCEKRNIAYIGTNGIEYGKQVIKTENTTPTNEKLYKYLTKLQEENYNDIVMEVSSESLLHQRVIDFQFQYAIFTTITEDHLNIHKTIQNYIESKLSLASLVKEDGAIIINQDDRNCRLLLNRNLNHIYTYGKDQKSDFQICNIQEEKGITTFDIQHQHQNFHIISPYVGEYNVYNLCAAFIVCYLEGIDSSYLIQKIKTLPPIKGRTESLDFGQNYKLILDYAHTLNGIKNIVESFQGKYKRTLLLTGAAGGREKEKREKIGKYILNHADFVIFTMDDPRYESVDCIIDQMIGNEKKNNYIRIINREEAIRYTLDMAEEDDLVLILGKGRDNYMAIEDKRIDYCDYDVISRYFHNSSQN